MVLTKASRGKSPPLKRLAIGRGKLVLETHKTYEPSSFRIIFIFSLTQSKVSFDKLFLRNINIFKSTSYYTIIILRQVYFGRDFSLRSEGVMKCPGG